MMEADSWGCLVSGALWLLFVLLICAVLAFSGTPAVQAVALPTVTPTLRPCAVSVETGQLIPDRFRAVKAAIENLPGCEERK